jgi:hypothetical protein
LAKTDDQLISRLSAEPLSQFSLVWLLPVDSIGVSIPYTLLRVNSWQICRSPPTDFIIVFQHLLI